MMCLVVGTGEVISVFVRKKNAGIITDADCSQALVNFRAEVIDHVDFKLAPVGDTLVFASYPLIEKHSLNATDACVVRSALDIAGMLRPEGHDIALITSDNRQLRAAQAEGLKTFDPENGRQEEIDALLSS
jgi:predicted nucleic acid-binding protein